MILIKFSCCLCRECEVVEVTEPSERTARMYLPLGWFIRTPLNGSPRVYCPAHRGG